MEMTKAIAFKRVRKSHDRDEEGFLFTLSHYQLDVNEALKTAPSYLWSTYLCYKYITMIVRDA